MYSVVFHPCYYGKHDSGYRLYKSDDQYLQEYPGMYSDREDFPTLKAAQAHIVELNTDHNRTQDACDWYDSVLATI